MRRRGDTHVTMVALVALAGAGLASPPLSAQDESFRTDTLAPGVYALVRPVSPALVAISNHLVIVDDDGVTVVDSGITPRLARGVLREVRRLTDRPVRYLINTHWHDDHVLGNQVFRDSFPDLRIIGHPRTREAVLGGVASALETNRVAYAEALEDAERALATGALSSGSPVTPEVRARLERQAATFRWFNPQIPEIRIEPPDLTVAGDLVLHRPGREIHVRFLGRGNTYGDLVVFLPRERIVASGDLLVSPVPYSFGSYLGEWVETLGRLRELGADVIVPGHGDPQRDRRYLDQVRELLSWTLAEARAAAAAGLDLEATREAVDLSAWRTRFTGDDPVLDRGFQAFFVQPAVERAWLEATGRLDEPSPPGG